MCDERYLGVAVGDKSQEWFLRRLRAMPAGAAAAPENEPPAIDAFDPTIFLYDHYSGGIGLAEALHPQFPDLLQASRDRIGACPCAEGCPSCVGPVREVGPRAKSTALTLLGLLIPRLVPEGAPLTPFEEPDPVSDRPPDVFES